ncbi:protein pxr1-like [Nicotiana sylvestris]|uniref:protein pxr1-like n=1 Tax=Nicotiana sylvestris TaxID=4096 RepID=UPI00388CD24C
MNSDSEEDTYDFAYATFIRSRSKPVATIESIPKRSTTRLQQNEALEFALKKSQRSKIKRMLVKDGKVVHEKVVPVVNVDEEEEEEPSSLIYKFSKQKHSHSQSIKHTSSNAESTFKSADSTSSEKLVKTSGDKIVKESSDKYDDEEVEKSGEHMHKKSVEKGKSIRKLVKRKMDDDEEPDSIKKEKVSESLSSEKRKLRNQKVLWGCTFASDVLELAGMRQLVEICDSKQWTNLFTNEVPKVYEEEV